MITDESFEFVFVVVSVIGTKTLLYNDKSIFFLSVTQASLEK